MIQKNIYWIRRGSESYREGEAETGREKNSDPEREREKSRDKKYSNGNAFIKIRRSCKSQELLQVKTTSQRAFDCTGSLCHSVYQTHRALWGLTTIQRHSECSLPWATGLALWQLPQNHAHVILSETWCKSSDILWELKADMYIYTW